MTDQVETFLGWTGLGFGVLLAYGAYKNVPILGPQGLLTTSLKTGKVPTVQGKGVVGPPAAHTGKTLPRKPPNVLNPLKSGPAVVTDGVKAAKDFYDWYARTNKKAHDWIFGADPAPPSGGDWTSSIPVSGVGW